MSCFAVYRWVTQDLTGLDKDVRTSDRVCGGLSPGVRNRAARSCACWVGWWRARRLSGLCLLCVLLWPAAGAAIELNLTPEERAWLEAHPVIRIGIDADYAPYSFINREGRYVGVAPDILALLEKQLGLEFQVVPDLNWPEIIAGARSHKLDLIATAVATPERRSFLAFTDIYIPTPLVIMTRQDDSRINDAADLNGRIVALVDGYSSSEQVMEAYPRTIRHRVHTPLEGLEAVATGAADAYVGVLGINIYLASAHGITNLKVAGSYNLVENGQRLAVRGDWPELATILNKALAALPETQKIAILQRWVSMPREALFTRERLVGLAVLGVLLGLTIGVAWIAVLRGQRNRLLQAVGERTHALHKSERRLALALKGGGMAAWDMDFTSGAMVVSAGWWDLMDFPASDTGDLRSLWLRLIHIDDRETVLDAERAYREGKTERFNVEYRVVALDGSIRWHVAVGSGVDLDPQGCPARMLGIVQDITERKRLEGLKNEFISSVSHELRTPLTSIKGALGLVIGGATGTLPEKAMKMLRIAYDNSERLILLINDLLDIDKVQAGKIRISQASLCIADLLENAVQANQSYADKFGVTLQWTRGEADHLHVHGDESRLMQVLSNLLSNAAKYSPAQGSVIVGASRHAEYVRISIEDKGPGIDVVYHDRVFERFFQVDASDRRSSGGTGLGLAISKEIVLMHGGRIGFSSELGQGATFYFELPVVGA